jgi:transcriptional regulator with XRE-family HTH domain
MIYIKGSIHFHPARASGKSGSLKDRMDWELKRQRKQFCQKLKTSREALGLSQRDLALMIGCNQSLVSRVERGMEVDFLLFQRWAGALNTPTNNFLSGEDIKPDPTSYEYLGHTLPEWKLFLTTRRWKT